jgi:hypothetical protein
MAIPKWTDERTEQLENMVNGESPVSQATVADAAEALDTTVRSVSSKLRKMGYDVELAASAGGKSFSPEQEEALAAFVTDNSGAHTYAEIAAAFEGGAFSPKSIQGKILSMQLTGHVKPAPKVEATKTYTDEEEAAFIAQVESGAFIEDIADAMGRSVNSVRGKALSLLRAERISAIPKQRETKGSGKADALEGVDLENSTAEEIAEQIGKTVRGVKTMLTRRGLVCKDYDGSARKDRV